MKKTLHATFCLALLILISGPCTAFALNECEVPPFVNFTAIPNILIGFDNSGSMYDLAYTKDGSYCYDNTYYTSPYYGSYYGYYDNDKTYMYSNGKFSEDVTDSMPASASSCSNLGGVGYPDFCIQASLKKFYFKGSFLNWLTMSKLDLMKRALTGGKYSAADQTLVGESRGCTGRRFVKEVTGSGFSFAVMGSKPFGDETQYGQVYAGGTTQIEIYQTDADGFNYSDCAMALYYIEQDQLGQGKQYTDKCLGLTMKAHEMASFNHSAHYCWQWGKHGDPGQTVQDIKSSCGHVYDKIEPPDQITTTDGSYVCSANYVGLCWQQGNSAWPNDGDVCVNTQLQEYCKMLQLAEAIDPSVYLQSAGAFNNIPALLFDSGIVGQMGEPLATLLNVKTQAEEPAVGVLRRPEIKNGANWGLIAFNNFGSRYELDDEVASFYGYTHDTDQDGAEILSLVQPSNTEIIGKFNDLEAYAWTPIAELLYETTRYFAGDSSAYNSGVTHTDPATESCQKSVVLFLSDGGSTYDKNVPGSYFSGTDLVTGAFDVRSYLENDTEWQTEQEFGGTSYAKGVAYWAHQTPLANNMPMDFYTVFTLGGATGDQLLQDIAKFGGYVESTEHPFPDDDKSWKDETTQLPYNYFSVSNPTELETALGEILQGLLQQQGGAGAVATVTQQMGVGDVVVRGAFTSYDENPDNLVWRGHLESYWPYDGCADFLTQTACEAIPGCSWQGSGCTGTMYSFLDPANAGKFCSEFGYEKCWDAQNQLPTAAARNIFTVINGTREDFTSSNGDLCNETNDWLELSGDSLTGAGTLTEACREVVEWVRGPAVKGQDDESWARNRSGWVLGDIVYSTPVVVEQPSLGSVPESAVGDACFGATSDTCTDPDAECARKCFYGYREINRYRKKMIYVGANDGMLHAFVAGKWDNTEKKWLFDPNDDSEIGQEKWAYIPSNILPQLKELARATYGTSVCWHRFMVDLSPEAYDAFIDVGNSIGGQPVGKEWRTVLLGGERSGGDVYFAIDVTDPDNPKVLWEYSVLRNMVLVQDDAGSKTAVAPYLPLATYKKVNSYPASWSVPSIGRLSIPDDVTFKAWEETYNPLKPDPTSTPTPATWTNATYMGNTVLSDWFVFIGGGVRLFDPLGDLPSEVADAQKKSTIKPYLMMIDLEKGINVFQYLWPMLRQGATSLVKWPDKVVGNGNYIPYAMTNTVPLDIDQDGNVDHLYFGDMNGQFYSMRFNLDAAATPKGVRMDIWPTKAIVEATVTNYYRSDRQPIGSTPILAFDRDPSTRKYRLRAYFGTGKFDNVSGTTSDRDDQVKMSFYNLLVDEAPTVPPDLSPAACSPSITGNSISMDCDPLGAGLSMDGFVVAPHVESAIPISSTPPPENPNFPHSIFDFFLPGERAVDSAMVAGKLAFVATFVPRTEACSSGGDAYLYILDYAGMGLSKDPLSGSGFHKTSDDASLSSLGVGQYTRTSDGKYIAKLSDVGLPSHPVLDSSGHYVLIQTSDARIHKIEVQLEKSPLTIRGWKEEEAENP